MARYRGPACWMNERNGWMDGWTDVNSEHRKSSSPVDDLVLWDLLINTGLGAMVRGVESPLWGASVSSWETLGWLVCLPVAWTLCCPFLDRRDATEQLCPLCAPKRWPPHMSPCWWFICEKAWNSRGILQRRPSGVREAIIHDTICQVQVPLALPLPPPPWVRNRVPHSLSSSLLPLLALFCSWDCTYT